MYSFYKKNQIIELTCHNMTPHANKWVDITNSSRADIESITVSALPTTWISQESGLDRQEIVHGLSKTCHIGLLYIVLAFPYLLFIFLIFYCIVLHFFYIHI